MDDSFNPLDLLECDVVEEDGEVHIPEVNKDDIENKDGNGEVSAEIEHASPCYLQTPEPIFDLVHYSLYQPSPVTPDNSHNSVQEFLRPTLLGLLNSGQNVGFNVRVIPTRAPSAPLPPLTAAPTKDKIWNHSLTVPTMPVPTMPKLVPIPRPIWSTSVAPPASAVVWNPSASSEEQPIPSTSTASSPPVIDLEKDPLAIRPPNTPLLCSHAETSFRCDLHRHISKYSVTIFRLHCTSCGEHIKSTLNTVDGAFKTHKVLRVLVCWKCSEFYGNVFFPIEDGSEIYCFWCGKGGHLHRCSNCPKSFCEACLIRNFGSRTSKQIAEKTNWTCFVCDFHLQGKMLWIHRAIPTLLLKHIKQLRSEAALLMGEEKMKVLNQDFSMCCIDGEVRQTIEVVLPYSVYSKIPQHLIAKLYKLVCTPGTEPAHGKPSLIVAEETSPGCVSIEQRSETENQLTEISKAVAVIDLTRDSSLAVPHPDSMKWLSKVMWESEQFINDFKLKLSYCNVQSKNVNDLSVSCLIHNLESLLKSAVERMRKIYNNFERKKKTILKDSSSSPSHVATSIDTTETVKVNKLNIPDSCKMDVEPSEQQVLQMENKENQFNKNNVDMLEDSCKRKVITTKKKKQSSLASKSLSRKRKSETSDNITDYEYLFKKYKLKNCNVVLERSDINRVFNLKKCNVVLKRTDIVYK